MSIDFTPDRWQEIRQTYRRWWAGELDRPIVGVRLNSRQPRRRQPAVTLLSQATCADLSVPADDVVDRLDWELSRQIFLGDAFPFVSLECFGPGVIAAFLGATLDNSTGRVWFHPPRQLPISELHLQYDPENAWLRRIKDLCAAMVRRWQGQVLVGMTDLGGNLDILSTFRPSDGLLLDLYDHPEEVQRVLGEAHELWHRFFAEINQVLQPHNPGYSTWCGIYSDRPYYILQCDFCYMIGPDMFARFVQPELAATTRRLDRTFYHLDGKGQLQHLQTVLGLERLAGVQWIPGAGQPASPHWPQVHQRILSAGKKSQVCGGTLAQMHALLQRTGVGPGVHCVPDIVGQGESEIRAWLQRLGVGEFNLEAQHGAGK
jgi:5-methyltetrahydrofolate--homocysteine methyltransferase